MKQRFYRLLLIFVIWSVAGCQSPQPASVTPNGPQVDGLKLSDLKDNSGVISEQHLMTFRVLTYTIVPDSVDRLKEVIDGLSREDIRESNQKAFQANGFVIGVAHGKQVAEIARKLSLMGAVRAAQSSLMFPPGSQQTLSQNILQPAELIDYAKTADLNASISQMHGFLGWVFSAEPDKRLRRAAVIKLYPATWQPGIEDIRLVMGKEAIDYQPISAGQVLARIEEGGIILLAPAREVPEETTLDKKLFFIPGRRPKIQFYVIICDSVGV